MNKKLSKILSCGVCLTMAAVFTAGCNGSNAPTGAGADPETRPFVMAIGATDGNFNPFFSTAQYDTQITELTQISMLNADESGSITYGKNEPTVVLDMKETTYTDRQCTTPGLGSKDGATRYEFVIKNGIKFSNGTDLTIKDVLFNLYVYLDPVYFGSSTIYSTKIQGLARYRNQDPLLDPYSDDESDISSTFDADAQSRINYLMKYLEDGTVAGYTKAQLDADKEELKKLYLEEVTSDWTTSYGTLESYEKEYRFESNWEVYYFNEGLISVLFERQANGNWVERKDEQGRYLTTLDEVDEDGFPKSDLRELMEEALADEELISEAMTKYRCSTREEALAYVERDFAIDTVYKTKADADTTLLSIFTEGWATSSNLRDKFAKEAMSKYFEDSRKNDGSLEIENISGIETYQTSTFNGKNLGEPHDVLQVTINGVDPKAIWNMAFQVAPAYYYSGIYKGTDYREIDIAKNQFGVCFGDSNFFDSVLGGTQKSKLPVGAGVYKASTSGGGTATDGDDFHNNKVAYYIRNDYFETVGFDGPGESEITNAKIKYVRYREVDTANLVSTLKTGEVDYGEPSCTQENINSLNRNSRVNLGYTTADASGYGYVGINPKYIPDINVRQAIMSAMNVQDAVSYYGSYASPIYRPMSKANWVYKDWLSGLNSQYYPREVDATRIRQKLEAKGWDFSSGVGKKGDYTLKYTFTIAGGTEDHPAYLLFTEAAKRLNRAGFQITVTTSSDALKSLATGALTVWAAAYTSPIDPDLYQVYHKDSKATSVKNWGYDSIKNDASTLFTTEKATLNHLSDLIIKARESTDQSVRGPLYQEALEDIMKLAIQLPTYQRKDLIVYNRDLLDTATLNTDASPYAGVLNKIWKVNYRPA